MRFSVSEHKTIEQKMLKVRIKPAQQALRTRAVYFLLSK